MSPKSSTLTPKGQRTRMRIIEAADRLMSCHGVGRVTLDDVRAEARVSSSQIYHYFTDKQSLIGAVVDYQDALSLRRESMPGSFESLDAVRSWVLGLIERQHDAHIEGGCPIVTLGTGLSGLDDDTITQLATMFRRCEDDMRAGYRAMHTHHEIGLDTDPDALATMTLATALGALVLTRLNRDSHPLRAALEALLGCLEAQRPVASKPLATR